MALTTAQEAIKLFKKLMGVSDTVDPYSGTASEFFVEPFISRSSVYPTQIWTQYSQIPYTSPTGMTNTQVIGVVQYFSGLTLTAVTLAASNTAYFSPTLINAIPFNFGDGVSYSYVLKDSLGNVLPFGQQNWVVDTDAGILMFYGSAGSNLPPANMPPSIGFYKYVGTLGILSAATSLSGDTDVSINNPASGNALVYNGSVWVNSGITTVSTLSGDTDVAINGMNNNDLLTYSTSTGKWINKSLLNIEGTTWSATTIYINSSSDSNIPGNDTTGNGTSGQPYATIDAAITSIGLNMENNITLQFSGGTFTFSQNTAKLIERIRGAGFYLYFNGIYQSIQPMNVSFTNPVINSYGVSDPTVMSVSTSNGFSGITSNQYLGYTALYGASPTFSVPIFENTAGTGITFNITVPYIYPLTAIGTWGTNIYMNNDDIHMSNISPFLYFENLNFTGFSLNTLSFTNIYILSCKISQNTGKLNNGTTQIEMFPNWFNNNIQIELCYINNCDGVLYGNSTNNLFQFTYSIMDARDFNDGSKGLNLNFSQVWIYNLITAGFWQPISPNWSTVTLGGNCKFKADLNFGGGYFHLGENPTTINLSWNFNMYCDGKIQSLIYWWDTYSFLMSNYHFVLPLNSVILLTANTATYYPYYAGSPPLNKYVSLVDNLNVYIKGYDFPEIEQKLTQTINYSGTTSFGVGTNRTSYGNKTILINFEATRANPSGGTDYREGQIRILNTGTQLLTNISYQETNDIQLTFSVSYDVVITTQIDLLCTVSSLNYTSIDNISFVYDVERIMM